MKKYKLQKFGNKAVRRVYSKLGIPEIDENMFEVQTRSFDWFIKDGIKEAFEEIQPINVSKKHIDLNYLNHEIDFSKIKNKKEAINNAINKKGSFQAPLFVDLRATNHETGEIEDIRYFLLNLPIMTDTGTFIINGAERVVVSQMVKSPGIYFSPGDSKYKGKVIASITPDRGEKISIVHKEKNKIKDDINHKTNDFILEYSSHENDYKSMPIFEALHLLGLKLKDIKNLFSNNLLNSQENFEKLNSFLKDLKVKDYKNKSVEKVQEEFLKNAANTRNFEEFLSNVFEDRKEIDLKTRKKIKSHFEFIQSLKVKYLDETRYKIYENDRKLFSKKLKLENNLLGKYLGEDIIVDGKVLFEKSTKVTKRIFNELVKLINDGFFTKEFKMINPAFDSEVKNKTIYLDVIKIYDNITNKNVINFLGKSNKEVDKKTLMLTDLIISFSNYFLVINNINEVDDIDHLKNKKVKSVGKLLKNQLKIGISRVSKNYSLDPVDTNNPDFELSKIKFNQKPIESSVIEFFQGHQLSQYLDQINPLTELTHKRRVSSLGPGGVKRESAKLEVRDVHYTYYGRIDPIETPEGQNIGLINSLALFAKVNDDGQILAPYKKVNKETFKVDNKIVYFSSEEVKDSIVAVPDIELDKENKIINKTVLARDKGKPVFVDRKEVDLVDAAPQEIVSLATSCIPFLEHDDSNRALMGANMQRQAIPLIKTDSPIVGTGIEYTAAKASGLSLISDVDGEVTSVDYSKIVIKNSKEEKVYKIEEPKRTNQSTWQTQKPIVLPGEKVKKGDILTDASAMQNGELALGQNPLIGFMTWNGYNYEDAIIISERLVREDVYTSIHVDVYEIECRETKLGSEQITKDIPNTSEEQRKNLDEKGIIMVGKKVKGGDILVGKVTPKGSTALSQEEKMLQAIFGDKAKDVRDSSLRLPNGADGIVQKIEILSKDKKDKLPTNVSEIVRIFIAQKRKIKEGDKMAGRHGNKGVISVVLPVEDMPYMEDGTPLDILLNPLGIPSRMNIGQLLELHLGMAGRKLNQKIATPVFDGVTKEDLQEIMKEANIPANGKYPIYDGRTGEKFDKEISVGVMYMLKLNHMVDDKMHSRSTGPYSIITQQPLGGKAQFGGQRFGEMEVWALEAYGAANVLKEMLTVKSDDVVGRSILNNSLINGENYNDNLIPESFKVLTKELLGLGIDVKLYNENNKEYKMKSISKELE